MKAKLVPIGNSKGVRIPKALLEQCNLQAEVELDVRGDALVIRSPKGKRQGWKAAFQKIHESGEDALLDGISSTEWDKKSWRW